MKGQIMCGVYCLHLCSNASLFQCCEHFPGHEGEGAKTKVDFFTRFTVIDFTWLCLKIQQSAILIPKSTTDDTSCHLGSAKADTEYGKLGLDNEFKGDTC